MLDKTYQEIKASPQSQLIVSFVLLPEQKNVYNAFVDQLDGIRSILETPASISFDKQSIQKETNLLMTRYVS